SNTGTAAVAPVSFVDATPLPVGHVTTLVNPPGWDCTITKTVSCKLQNPLPPGGVEQGEIKLEVEPKDLAGRGCKIPHNATLTAGGVGTSSAESARPNIPGAANCLLQPRGSAKLEIKKVGECHVNDQVICEFKLSIHNAGTSPAPANEVRFTDEMSPYDPS